MCAPVGGAQISPIVVQKLTDIASVKLFATVAAGTVFDVVTITVVKTDAGTVADAVQYKLKDAFIHAYETASSGDRPSESLTLQFKSLELTTFDPEGPPQTTTWAFCGASR